MSLNLVRVFVAGGIAVASLSVTSQAQEPRPIQDRDSYAVYASFVSTLADPIIPGRRVDVFQETVIVRRDAMAAVSCLPTGKPLQEDWKPVMDSYLKENQGDRTILEGFDIGVPYVTAPAEILRALDDSRWRPGDFRPPPVPRPPPPPPRPGEVAAPTTPTAPEPILGERGLLRFSAVGFDRQKRRAMAAVSYYSNKWGGHGGIYFFQKTNGRWKRVILPDLRNPICVA